MALRRQQRLRSVDGNSKDEDPKAQKNAANTLGNGAGDREVQLLIAARDDPDGRVREGFRHALEIIKHRMRGNVTNLRRIPIPEQ